MRHYLRSLSPNREDLRRTFAWVRLCAAIVFVAWLTLGSQANARGQASGVEGGQTAASPSPDVVEGTVVNRVTHEPVARALVYTPDNLFAVLTDDRGRFEFKFPARENTPPPSPPASDDPAEVQAQQQAMQLWNQRNYRADRLFVRRPGFLPSHNGWRFRHGSALSGHPLVIELEPEGHIVGHVQAPNADGLERGQIQIYRQEFGGGQSSWRLVDTARIRANGEFRFAELPAGTYKLFTLEQMERTPPIFNPRSQLFGYPPVYFPNSKDFASAMPIHLAAGATFEGNISLVRREYYPVRIGVSGAAVRGGVSLVVYPQGHPGPGYELGFDPGEGAIRGFLPDGSYTLKLSLQQDQGSSGVLNFTVRGAQVDGVSMALVPNISLGLNIKTDFRAEARDEEQIQRSGGFQANQVGITLRPVDSFENAPPVQAQRPPSGAENEWTFPNITPGTYRMQINSFGSYVVSATWGGSDLLHHPMVVGTDGTGTPIEVVLRDDGAEVTGTVQEPGSDGPRSAQETGAPTSFAFVYFVPVGDSDGQFREMRAVNGHLGTKQIPPGTYRVLAFAAQQKELDFLNAVEMRKYDSKGIVVQLAPNQKENLPAPLTLVDEP